jgi:hypothetical protein
MEQEDRPKIGLALSGASTRATFYVGFLEVLSEHNIPIDFIVASSSGSIVAMAYACGTLPQLKDHALRFDAYQNIDAEAEITSIMGEYIAQEIDWEIYDMLMNSAQSTEYWSATIGREWNGSSAFDSLTANYTAYTQGSWFQTLGTKMQKLSNRIHALTMRGGANFVACSPTVATILESIPGYAADTDGDKFKFAMGAQKIGMINSKFQVYKIPYLTENVMLMGYRGSNYLECGAVYSPYIPLIMTQTIPDPDTFEPRKGALTRYAKKVTRPEFYGKIYIEGLNRL